MYFHFFQFDDNVTNSATWQPTVTVESGSPVYNISNNGKSFELESAVLNLGTSAVTNGFAALFGLNIQIKVDADATDGVILSCDDIANSRPCWTLELIDTASSPKIIIRMWSSSNGTQSYSEYSIPVPSTGTSNNYQYELHTTTLYKRVNGEAPVLGYGFQSSNWRDVPTGLNPYIFEFRVGSSLYNITTASATGVHLDWYVLSMNNEGYIPSSNDDTSVRSYSVEAASAVVPPSAAIITATTGSSDTTDCAVPQKRPIISTLHKRIREFWS